MIEEEKKTSVEKPARAFRLDPEILLAACILFFVVYGYIGLRMSLWASLAGALAMAILALVAGDLVFSLDYRRALLEAADDEKKQISTEAERFENVHRPLYLMAGSLACLILNTWVVALALNQQPEKSTWGYIAFGLTVVLGVLLWMLGPCIVTGVRSEKPEEKAPALAGWSRLIALILWISAPSYIGAVSGVTGGWPIYIQWFHRAAAILLDIAILEIFLRSTWALIYPGAAVLPPAPIDSLVASSVQTIRGIFSKAPEMLPGTTAAPSVRFRWLGDFLRRSLPRVVLGLVVILWLATSLTQVGVSDQGLRERFGRFTGQVLEPGLHLGWPWPIDHVRRFPAHKLQIMKIGFVAEESAARTNLIWTEAHGIDEDRFVTASGSEVISFDIELHYRIADVVKYAYTCSNPETLLRDLAYTAIMLRTHDTDTDTLLGRDRAALAEGLEEDIQRWCDAEEIGIEVAQVVVVAIHPPFEVAGAYQAVVSAQVYRDTLAIQASTYMEEIIPAARASAQRVLDEAGAYAVERVAKARGEASGFASLSTSAMPDFDLFRFRRRMEILETGLENKRIYVVSSGLLESETGEDRGLWFDLR